MAEEDTSDNKQPAAGTTASEQNKKVLKLVLIAVAVLLVLGVIGSLALGIFFSKGIERAIDQASDGIVELNDENFFAGEDELPEGFPEEIPLYEDGEVVASTFREHDDKSNYVVTFRTGDDAGSVRDFYSQALSSEGWNITSTATVNDSTSYVAVRNGLRISVNIVAAIDNQETTYTITADK